MNSSTKSSAYILISFDSMKRGFISVEKMLLCLCMHVWYRNIYQNMQNILSRKAELWMKTGRKEGEDKIRYGVISTDLFRDGIFRK